MSVCNDASSLNVLLHCFNIASGVSILTCYALHEHPHDHNKFIALKMTYLGGVEDDLAQIIIMAKVMARGKVCEENMHAPSYVCFAMQSATI